MVKNKTGGSKHKSMARKSFSSNNNYNASLRKSEEEDEMYAMVVKMLGGGMCHVDCLDNNVIVKRLCIIRNKFRGKSKRDNTLNIGSYVLVGVRSWETKKDGSMEKCDLLEVYNESSKERLRTSVNLNWDLFKSDINKEENDILFSNIEENNKLELAIENKEISNTNTIFRIDEEINIDDI
jgi:translation initiation factor IF-1